MVAPPPSCGVQEAPSIVLSMPMVATLLRLAGSTLKAYRDLEERRRRVRAERTYLRNPNIAPVDKLVALDTLWEIGCAPDSPNPDRPKEWKPVFRESVASHLGV